MINCRQRCNITVKSQLVCLAGNEDKESKAMLQAGISFGFLRFFWF